MIFPKRAEPEWVEVDLGKFGTFEVQVDRPTWSDKVADWDGERSLEHRIKATVKGWRGITDEDGKEIPFSHENLIKLADAVPSFVDRLVAITGDAFYAEPEKNSAPPSSES